MPCQGVSAKDFENLAAGGAAALYRPPKGAERGGPQTVPPEKGREKSTPRKELCALSRVCFSLLPSHPLTALHGKAIKAATEILSGPRASSSCAAALRPDAGPRRAHCSFCPTMGSGVGSTVSVVCMLSMNAMYSSLLITGL